MSQQEQVTLHSVFAHSVGPSHVPTGASHLANYLHTLLGRLRSHQDQVTLQSVFPHPVGLS